MTSNLSDWKNLAVAQNPRDHDLQSFTKYLRLTIVLCEIAHYGKSLISVFQEFFASINKSFILSGTLNTKLSFYEF